MAEAPIPAGPGQEVLTQPVGGPQASGELRGVGAAYGALADLGQQIHEIGIANERPKAEAAGAAAVSKDPDTGEITVKSIDHPILNELDAAYQHGAAVAFASQTESDQHQKFADLAAANPTDPQLFEAGASAYLKAQAKGAPAPFRADLLMTGQRLITQFRNGIAERAIQSTQEKAVDSATNLINTKSDEWIQLVAQSGGVDTPEAHQIHQEIANLWSSLADNPLTKISRDHAQAEMAKLQGRAMSEALLRQLDNGTVGLSTVEAALRDPHFGGTTPTPPNFDTTKAPGMVAAGNLDPWSRPVLHNADGTFSTEQTIGIGTDKGEVVIPTVVDGKRLTNEEAIARFKSTGENFGTFKTSDQADAYALALHNAHASMFDENGNPKGGSSAFTTSERLSLISRAEALVTDKETKRREAETEQRRQAGEVSDAFLKNAFDLKASGRLTTDWIQQNRASMNAADYRSAYELLKSESITRDDPQAIIALTLDKDRLPPDQYRAAATRALARGAIKTDTFRTLIEQNTAAFRDDQPASPFRQGRDFVRNSLDVNPFGAGPDFGAKKQTQANALQEYDNLLQANPQISADDALANAHVIVSRYSLLDDAVTPGAIGSPYGFRGSLNAVTPQEVTQAAARLKAAYSIGILSDAQYQAEVAKLGSWQRVLTKKAANTAKQPKAP